MTTSVILVCVKLCDPNYQLVEDELRSVFGSFANVIDVFIFERDPVIKAFVQVESEEVAAKVIETFNERVLGIGSMRLYNSRKNGINCKKKRWLRSLQNPLLTKASTGGNYIVNKCVVHSQFRNESSVNDPQFALLQQSSAQFLGTGLPLQSLVSEKHASLSLPMLHSHKSTVPVHSQSAQELNGLPSNAKPVSWMFEDHRVSSSRSHLQMESFGFELRSLNSKLMNRNTLLSLFNLCGTVASFHINVQAESVAVWFSTKAEYSRAKASLHGLRLFGNILSIANLQKNSIPENERQANHQKSEPDKPFESNDPTHLLSEERPKHQLAPSTVIRIDNLPDSCTPVILYDIIGQIHEPRKIIRLTEKTTNFSVIFAEFPNNAMSLEVLIVLNLKRVDGNCIAVSLAANNSFTNCPKFL
jgi:hypothetical protein